MSIGNVKQQTTGTLGAVVRDLTTPARYVLSNWHVLWSEQFDAALGQLADGIELSEQLFGTAISPTATTAPFLGMSVIKSGAVFGVTQALVDGVAGVYRIDYTSFGDGPQWMSGFRLVPDTAAPATALSLEGDSGSVWVERSSGMAVGLHFAGEDEQSPLNDYALAHSIEEVFARLNVALMTSPLRPPPAE